MSDRASSRRETRSKREYGRFTVERNRASIGGRTEWIVVGRDGETWSLGAKKDGRRDAQALAAAFDKANVLDMDDLLPSKSPDKYTGGEWEEWAAAAEVVPADLVGAGKPAVAAWMKVVLGVSIIRISHSLDVSEQSVRQYLADLRADR